MARPDLRARIEAVQDQWSELPIVDAHHHLWDLSGPLSYPWLTHPEFAWLGDYSTLGRDYLPPQYRRDSALHNVVATVHVEAEADRRFQVEETAWVSELNARYGMPNAVVAHAWVDTPDAEEIIARQAQFPLVRGVRTKPIIAATPNDSVRGQPRSLQDPKWIEGLDLLTRHGLSWDLRLPWWHLAEGADVVRQHPDLPVVVNHTGYPWNRDAESLALWRAGMAALAANDNVMCKLSALCVTGQPWNYEENRRLIREAISIFGVNRCMFATNFPVDGLKGSWDFLMSSYKAAVGDFARADMEKLFAGNAARFYRIELAD